MKMLLIGDVMLGRLVNGVLKDKPAEFPWGDTLPLFHAADWRMCNLECVLSDWGEPWSQTAKVFHFRSDAKNIAVLQAARINAVSLANNHIIDYGYEALFECLRLLDGANILRAGAGEDFEEASRPATTDVLGLKVGVLAFADNQQEWEANPTKPGILFVPINLADDRAERLLEIVRQTKQQVDLLVVSAHWGGNWGYTPPEIHVAFGHALIDAGADVVFGHSCHVFRGIEIYRQRPIIYSAGDFVDDYAVDEIERNDQSFIFILQTDGSRMETLRLYPTVIRNFQAERARGLVAEQIALKMISLCNQLNTAACWNPAEQCLEIAF